MFGMKCGGCAMRDKVVDSLMERVSVLAKNRDELMYQLKSAVDLREAELKGFMCREDTERARHNKVVGLLLQLRGGAAGPDGVPAPPGFVSNVISDEVSMGIKGMLNIFRDIGNVEHRDKA